MRSVMEGQTNMVLAADIVVYNYGNCAYCNHVRVVARMAQNSCRFVDC